MKKPTAKQIAARKRNWKLCQLKSAMYVLKPYLTDYTIERIGTISKRKIDEQWKKEINGPF